MMAAANGSQGRLLRNVVALEERWHYEGGRRDRRLDLLRGFAAFAMIADHISGSESWLAAITGANRFFVSAAEAFVFISGAVMGIVYLHVVHEKGIWAGLSKALHRAGTLYVLTVFLTLAFAAAGTALNLWWRPDISNGGVPRFAFDVVTLHRTLFLTDIPLMYTLLLLAACPVIVLLWSGRTSVALALSFGIWAAWQLHPGGDIIPWHIEGNTVFFFSAWQLLFVTGLVVGWHRAQMERWVRHMSRPALFAGLGFVTLAVVALYTVQMTELNALRANAIVNRFAFDKADVPPGRLIVFVLLGTFAFTATTVFWDPIRRAAGWLLLPLGQNALMAYSVHVFLVAVTTKLSVDVLRASASTPFVSTAMQISGILAVWLVVVLEPKVKVRMLSLFGNRQKAAPVEEPLHNIEARRPTMSPEMRALARINARRRPTAFLSVAALLTLGMLAVSGGRGVEKTATNTPQAGPQLIERTVWSPSLDRDMPLTVYLPAGYQANTDARYPVLYMLHGLGGDHLEWQRDGLFAIATELIRRGDIPPMIIVTPEGEQGYWIDHANGGPRYGSYVANDLVVAIDHDYRTDAVSRFRAIGGMSMGAHGALQLALNNPNEFGVVGAHSLVLRNKDQAFDFFGDSSYFAAHDPVSICKRDQDMARKLVLWIDIGDEDSWLGAASAFDTQLQTEGVAHSWHVYAGGHTDQYWSSHLVDYLRFYGGAFRSASSKA